MTLETTIDQPLAGFPDPVQDSQRVFRDVLDAMAHPGKVITLPHLQDAPPPLHRATAAICMSLVDFETPLWADASIAVSGQAMTHLRFHCGCPVTANPQEARTALVSNVAELKSLELFNMGTDERPDLSTTVIVQVESLKTDGGVHLTGPGIKSNNRLQVQGVGAMFWSALQANSQQFPRGVDLILTADDVIVCLPRTTQVEV